MGTADVDIRALEQLRFDLAAFGDNQQHALTGVDGEVAHGQGILADINQQWQRELRRRRLALEGCEAAALLAAAAGAPFDCSAAVADVQEAQHELRRIADWQSRVDQAADAWRSAAQQYASYLASVLPALDAGLDARVTSLEAYHAWQIGLGGIGRNGMTGTVRDLEVRVAELRQETEAKEAADRERLASLPQRTSEAGTGWPSQSTGPTSDQYPPGVHRDPEAIETGPSYKEQGG